MQKREALREGGGGCNGGWKLAIFLHVL